MHLRSDEQVAILYLPIKMSNNEMGGMENKNAFLYLQKPHDEIRNKTNTTKYSTDEATACIALFLIGLTSF